MGCLSKVNLQLEIDLFVSIIGVYMDGVKYFETSGKEPAQTP